MLTWENCVEAQALRTKGWSISAIATHLGHDRKTIRAYLNGERRPGERAPGRPESLTGYVDYCRQRLADDPHLWLTTLFDEVVDPGFGGYQALSAALRTYPLTRQMSSMEQGRSGARASRWSPVTSATSSRTARAT